MFTRIKSPRKGRLLWIALLSSGFLTSCGYHVDDDEALSAFPTISVPYFNGDQSGVLTDIVVKSLSSSGVFNYANRGGAITLEGKIVSDNCENIGYQYDRHPVSGERINRLVPNEGRRVVTVEITLIDSRSLKTLYGPFTVSAYSDYDFVDSDSLQDASFINATGTRESVLFFSLGQLDSIDGAKAASLDPIYHRLATKITEGLSHLPYNIKLENNQ